MSDPLVNALFLFIGLFIGGIIKLAMLGRDTFREAVITSSIVSAIITIIFCLVKC